MIVAVRSDLDKLARGLAKAERGIGQAVARALNQGGDKVRTQVRHALQKQAGLVRYASVTQRTRSTRAYPGYLAYIIYASGKPTKPVEFRNQVMSGAGGGVTVWLWGRPHRFPRSFQITGASGAAGLRMRLGAPRLPIRGFDGPNLAKEAVKEKAAETFYASAATLVAPLVENALIKTLGGRP